MLVAIVAAAAVVVFREVEALGKAVEVLADVVAFREVEALGKAGTG